MTPASELHAGRVIGGRYRIQSLLGSGGMGVLYAAEHLLTQRKVALKVLHPSRDDEAELHARFLSEARTASAVRHPNVVDVLDMGTDERGLPFLVMELLEGRSLDRFLMTESRLSPERTLAWLLPVIGALAVLHEAGIVHRDVKPSNIFICHAPQGRTEPKLLDFGLARAVSDLRLTRSGVVIGTPLYMAPEHAAGAAVGPQADIWSLGVVLYECLSGTTPYRSTDGAAVATQVLAGLVQPLHLVCPELPQPLVAAIERALRRDLAFRYRDMREFARGLLAGAVASGLAVPENPDPLGLPEYQSWYGAELQRRSYAPGLGSEGLAANSPHSEAEPPSASRPLLTRRTWMWIAVAALVLASLGLLYGQPERTPASAATPPYEPPAALADEASERRPTPEPVVEPLQLPAPSAAEAQDAPPRAEPSAPTPHMDAKAHREEPKERPKRKPAPNIRRDKPPTLDVETEWK